MTCEVCKNELFEGALFCGECGTSVTAHTAASTVRPSDTEVIPRFFYDPHDPHDELADDELPNDEVAPVTALVGIEAVLVELMVEPPNPLFTLTLSTGESLDVSTNGLIGRMPQPDAGEVFGHLIVLADPARSVSKTHVEFGIEGDQLWVVDRNSGNGSIIRESGKVPRRAQPGQRYLVSRGTRIDMGDQYLLIT